MGSLDSNGNIIQQDEKLIRNSGNGIKISNCTQDVVGKRINNFILDRVPGCILRLDASDKSTFVFDENGRISSWSDKSENNFGPLTQSTPTSRPFYSDASPPNNKPALWNSSGQSTSLFINTPLFTDYPLTIFIATASNDATIDGALLWVGDKDTSGQDRVSIRLVGGGGQGDSADILISSGGTSVATSTIGKNHFVARIPCIVTAKLESANLRSVSLNRGEETENRQTLTLQNLDRTVIGREIDSTPTNPYSGYIYEVLVFNSVLSPSTINDIQEYLALKWGVELGA